MSGLSRRDWLSAVSASATLGGALAGRSWGEGSPSSGGLKIATFRCDVTPPMGHSLCGGWIKPVLAVDDPLEAIGVVILGADAPIVLCAVDWTGILNSAYRKWCETIATAVGTTPDRVAVQCVHQHDAIFACLDTQALLAKYAELPSTVDVEFLNRTMDAVAAAAKESLKSARLLTHIALGEAKVDRVAGNRRLPGPDGKLMPMRGSSSKNPEHKTAPEGLIDPLLKTVALYDGDQKVAACHYYACHPMSHYGQGRVSADFCGLARRKRQQEDATCTHLYFNGCGGNIAAGKYNDGSPEMRPILSGRIYDAIVAAEKTLSPRPVSSIGWRTQDVLLSPDSTKWNADDLAAQVADSKRNVVDRNRPAFTLAYLQRCERKEPITLSALHVNNASLIHLPSECFIEYQLHAQKEAADRFVACAAYGDGGPWYIPTREAFPQGGYEVSVAWCGPSVEDELWSGIAKILRPQS
jgi:hypothetical protein